MSIIVVIMNIINRIIIIIIIIISLRMRSADDFQTLELYKFTEAHLRHLGVSLKEVV